MTNAASSPPFSALSLCLPLSIARLSPTLPVDGSPIIESIVTLIWPYSSSTRTLSLLLADPDIRRRKSKGQVKVTFQGPAGRAVAESGVGIGDRVNLALEGVQWIDASEEVSTPGTKLEWDLLFQERALLQIERDSNQSTVVNVDQHETSPLGEISPNSLNGCTATSKRKDVGLWSSPTFVKDKLSSPGSFAKAILDNFPDNDGFVPGKGRKRSKFARDSGSWRLLRRSSSSERCEQKPDPRSLDDFAEPISNEQFVPAISIDRNRAATPDPLHGPSDKAYVEENEMRAAPVAVEEVSKSPVPVLWDDFQDDPTYGQQERGFTSTTTEAHDVEHGSGELENELIRPQPSRTPLQSIGDHSHSAANDTEDEHSLAPPVVQSNTQTPRLGPVTSPGLPLVSKLAQRAEFAEEYFPDHYAHRLEIDAGPDQSASPLRLRSTHFEPDSSGRSLTVEGGSLVPSRDLTPGLSVSERSSEEVHPHLQQISISFHGNVDLPTESQTTPNAPLELDSTTGNVKENKLLEIEDPSEVGASDFEFLNDSPVEPQNVDKQGWEGILKASSDRSENDAGIPDVSFDSTAVSALLNQGSIPNQEHVEEQSQTQAVDQHFISSRMGQAGCQSTLLKELAPHELSNLSKGAHNQFDFASVFPIDPGLFNFVPPVQDLQDDKRENEMPKKSPTLNQQGAMWRSKLLISASECINEGLALNSPPFPFRQDWQQNSSLQLTTPPRQYSFLDGAGDRIEHRDEPGQASAKATAQGSLPNSNNDLDREYDGRQFLSRPADFDTLENVGTTTIQEGFRNSENFMGEDEQNACKVGHDGVHETLTRGHLISQDAHVTTMLSHVAEFQNFQTEPSSSTSRFEENVEELVVERVKFPTDEQVEGLVNGGRGDGLTEHYIKEQVENPVETSTQVFNKTPIEARTQKPAEGSIEERFEVQTEAPREILFELPPEELVEEQGVHFLGRPLEELVEDHVEEHIEQHFKDPIETPIEVFSPKHSKISTGDYVNEHTADKVEVPRTTNQSHSLSRIMTTLPKEDATIRVTAKGVVEANVPSRNRSSPLQEEFIAILPEDPQGGLLVKKEDASKEQIFSLDPSRTTLPVSQLLTPDNTQKDNNSSQNDVLESSSEDVQLPTPRPTQLSVVIPERSPRASQEITDRVKNDIMALQAAPEHELSRRRSPRLSRKFTLAQEISEMVSPYFTPRHPNHTQEPSQSSSPAYKSITTDANELLPNKLLSAQEAGTFHREGDSITIASPRDRESPAVQSLRKGFSTPTSYYVPLVSMSQYFSQSIDIIAVCSSDATTPVRAGKGPKNWYTTLHLTDSSLSSDARVMAQIFRAYKNALPTVKRGETILLRGMKVQGQKRKCMLLSSGTSAWAIFTLSENPKELKGTPKVDVRVDGPPVEWGAEEKAYVRGLKKWWDAEGENRYSQVKDKGKQRVQDGQVQDADFTGMDDAEGVVNGVVEGFEDGKAILSGEATTTKQSLAMENLHELRNGTVYADDAEVGEAQSVEIERKIPLEDEEVSDEDDGETAGTIPQGRGGRSRKNDGTHVILEDLTQRLLHGLQDASINPSATESVPYQQGSINGSIQEEVQMATTGDILACSSKDERHAGNESDRDFAGEDSDDEEAKEVDGEDQDRDNNTNEDGNFDDDSDGYEDAEVESITDQAVSSQIYNEMTNTQLFIEVPPPPSHRPVSSDDDMPAYGGEDMVMRQDDDSNLSSDSVEGNENQTSDSTSEDENLPNDENATAIEEADDEDHTQTISTNTPIAPPLARSTRSPSTAQRRHRESSNVHELRDGMRWTDDPDGGQANGTRRESVVHELRDGFRWVDDL